MRFPSFLALTILGAGCMDSGKPEEDELELLDDAKDDSHRNPTDHGELLFGNGAATALTDDERHHAWTFELSGDAKVDMTTSYALLGQRRTDTVLYLYREGATGWGSYIARNDDYGNTLYSKLVRELGAGRYRVLVKGHQAETRGKFKITVNCAGDGCVSPATASCVFGSTYGDIETNSALETINSAKITAATLTNLNPDDQHKLMLAVQQSSHTDVTTPLEAIGRVDQGEVNVSWLAEPAAQRAFIAFEYGAGDNSYGAIFDRFNAQMVTNIHDGDLENCLVKAETCLLSDDWLALRSDPAFTIESNRVVTDASQVTGGVAIDQAMTAFGQSYDDVASVADGLSRVDGNRLNIVGLRHKTTGVRLEVFEYGAGDTSVGRIYFRNTTNPAGVINDLAIESCQLFE
ncbi:MAG: hypothetical protein H0V17_12735 [Deltaproteobacteria bacterium]|nr:hypothetical protein [Deltaproteobacteria bacterium]